MLGGASSALKGHHRGGMRNAGAPFGPASPPLHPPAQLGWPAGRLRGFGVRMRACARSRWYLGSACTFSSSDSTLRSLPGLFGASAQRRPTAASRPCPRVATMAALGAALPACRLRAPAGRAPGRARLAVRAVASPPAPSSVVWTPDSWRSKKAIQMPEYADPKALSDSVAELRRSPPLIFAGEVRTRRPPRRRRRRGCGRRCAVGFSQTHFSLARPPPAAPRGCLVSRLRAHRAAASAVRPPGSAHGAPGAFRDAHGS